MPLTEFKLINNNNDLFCKRLGFEMNLSSDDFKMVLMIRVMVCYTIQM